MERKVVDTISKETVRRTLKNGIKPWLKQIWCLPPKANADFVDAMADMLSVDQREFATDTVLVGMDEPAEAARIARQIEVHYTPKTGHD
ncbi:MAG: hypothetical protein OXC63_05565 [Aestuariivita sp.]|nr:hypothetical protein [Aestuariivita sp.]MCY4345809.1 hypothetical protein [Aestuariivita sp.]